MRRTSWSVISTPGGTTTRHGGGAVATSRSGGRARRDAAPERVGPRHPHERPVLRRSAGPVIVLLVVRSTRRSRAGSVRGDPGHRLGLSHEPDGSQDAVTERARHGVGDGIPRRAFSPPAAPRRPPCPACDDRRVPAGLVLAAALLSGAAPAAGPVRPALAAYDVAESTRTVSPAGERNGGTAGAVRVAGGRARWERRARDVPALDGDGRDRRRAARHAPRHEGGPRGLRDARGLLGAVPGPARHGRQRGRVAARRLRAPRPGREGPRVRGPADVEVRARGALDARPLDDRPRHARRDGAPGRDRDARPSRRRARRSTTSGASFPRAATRPTALEAELAKLPGLPVRVSFDVTSKSSVEQPGMPTGTEPPPRPLETRADDHAPPLESRPCGPARRPTTRSLRFPTASTRAASTGSCPGTRRD